MVPGKDALARLGFGKGNAGGLAEGLQGVMGIGIADAAAGDDQGALRGAENGRGAFHLCLGGGAAVQVPDPLAEEGDWVVIGFALHILGHGEADGAGIRRVGEDPQGVKGGGHELLRTLDAVKVMADAAEGVGDGLAEGGEELRLLQDRVRLTAGKGVAGQQEQGDAVGGGAAGGGDHVHGAGADGGHAGDDLEAVLLLGEGCGRQGHVLLILALEEADGVAALLEGLADADHAAVAEDAEDVIDEFVLDAVELDVLLVQETDEGLGHGQTDGVHGKPSFWMVWRIRGAFRSPPGPLRAEYSCSVTIQLWG